MKRLMKNLSRTLILLLCLSLPQVFVHAQDAAPAEEAATEQTESTDGLSADAAVLSKGKELFEGNCAQCHAVHEQVVGPALKNVYERREIPWLINFIKYPQKTIESGDEYAVALYEKFKAAGYMPNHDFLKDDDIIAILSYVKDVTLNPPVAAVAGGDGGAGQAVQAETISSNFLIAIIGLLVVILLFVLIVMVALVSMLNRYLKQQDGLTEEDKDYIDQKFDIGAFLKSPAFTGIVAFVFAAVVLKAVFDGLFAIGVQQGYAPEQPIKFSHKLHAGYYEIDCKYCHTGVEKSKSANIPSANICMNCHNSIRTTAPEIQKIYKAIETDTPIQWVRVHNLPDLSYFNHSQHVKVGGIDCQDCHGNIQEMEVVQQYSLLTMGWCIDCHRQRAVNSKDNAYYDRLVELHNDKSKAPMVVEDIGGLECAKCHY